MNANHLAAHEGYLKPSYSYVLDSGTHCDWASSTKTHTDKDTLSMLFDGGYRYEVGKARLFLFPIRSLEKDRHGLNQFSRLCALGRCFETYLSSFAEHVKRNPSM